MAFHQLFANRFVAEAAEFHLALQAETHIFDDHQESDDEQHPDDPGGKHHDLLAVGEGEDQHQNHRHNETGNQRATLELRIQFGEAARTFLDRLTVAALIGEHLNGLGHVVAAFRKLYLLADDHVAFLDLTGEQAVEIDQQRANRKSDEERDHGEHQ